MLALFYVDCSRKISFVPYIGTWIETIIGTPGKIRYIFFCIISRNVVPYIGTWIETDGISVFL